MKRKPWEFSLLCFCLILVAVSIPFQIFLMYGEVALKSANLLNMISPTNWMVMGAALLNAYLAFKASHYLIWTVPIFIAIVAYNNWLTSYASEQYTLETTTFATIAVIGMHLLLLTRSSRQVLENPHSKWWRAAKRKLVSVPASLKTNIGYELEAKTFDLSQGGAFFTSRDIKVSHHRKFRPRANPNRLPIGTRLNLQFSLHEDPDKAMFCTAEAEVVRTTTGKGKYPEGFAVRFLKINKAQQKHLTNFLEDVPAIV